MSDTTTVLFSPQKCFPPANAAHFFDSIKLVPGSSNQFTPEQLTTLTEHPDYPRYKAWGAIEILGATPQTIEKPATVGGDLSALSPEDAEKAIEGSHDVATLNAWYAAETRRLVRQQIQRRIKTIESGQE